MLCCCEAKGCREGYKARALVDRMKGAVNAVIDREGVGCHGSQIPVRWSCMRLLRPQRNG